MHDLTALSVAQTARILGIGRSTLYQIIKEGRLPVRKIGKRSLIMRDDIDRFVTSLPCGVRRG
jgi:excisionase family DNA binding protein